MTTKLTGAPTVEPITITELKDQIYIGSTFDDDKLTRIIESSRQVIEAYTDRSLNTQEWTMKLDKWPELTEIQLPKGRTQSITSFSYLDTDGNSQSLVLNTDYTFDNNGDIAVLSPVTSWPSVLTTEKGVITVVYSTGYGDAATDVEPWAKEAIMSMCVMIYDNGATDTSKIYKLFSDPKKIYFNYSIND